VGPTRKVVDNTFEKDEGNIVTDTITYAARPAKRRERPAHEPDATPDVARAAKLRAALVEKLRAERTIVSPAVQAAFHTVARERFLPAAVPLNLAYGVDNSVVTKREEQDEDLEDWDQEVLSAEPAPYLQAWMLEQARLRPGMTVLQIGSGGLTAAYLAETVGEDGHVFSVDIDPEVTDHTARLLDEAGYTGRVTVLTLDASQAVPDARPFDAIIVTSAVWDVAPAWLDALAEHGVLVLPLIMKGVTRVIGFRRDGDHLTSTCTQIPRQVKVQDDFQHPGRVFLLPDADGNLVGALLGGDVPAYLDNLHSVPAREETEVWSGVRIGDEIPFADLHLWFAWFLPRFSLLPDDDAELASVTASTSVADVPGSGFAYLTVRPLPDGAAIEFGARAYGYGGRPAAEAMVAQIQAWDRDGRHTEPVFGYWPTGSDTARIPAAATRMDKADGVVTVLWPDHR